MPKPCVTTFIIVALCLMYGCEQPQQMRMEQNKFTAVITEAKTLASVPSASAVEAIGNRLYLISDDAPGIFRCSMDGSEIESMPFRHITSPAARIPKPVKPDYEAAVSATIQGIPYIIAFGSGSMQPHRESVILITATHPEGQKVVSAKRLYAAMREAAGIPLASFNIEGAVIVRDKLLLLNRGGNHLFIIDWAPVLEHLMNEGTIPAIQFVQLHLPELGHLKPMCSGACLLDERRLLFSVSVEDTPDWISDGAVIGSGIGILDISNLQDIRLLGIAPLTDEKGKVPNLKLEGIYAGQHNGRLNIRGVVDNDDGSSQLLTISLAHIPDA